MPPEQLRVYRDNYLPNSAEHQRAKSELEIRESEASDKLEDQRCQEAIAMKQESEKKADGRFQIQFNETRRQNYWTRCLSVGALMVSVGSLTVAICALSSRKAQSPQLAPLTQQSAPAVSFSTTNAMPSTPTPTMPATKP